MVLVSWIKESPKATHVKNKTVTREKIGQLEDKGSKLLSGDVGKVLNEYFASVFTMEDSEIIVENTNMQELFEIKKEEVLGLLKSVKINISSGPDGMYPRLLREAIEEIAGALTRSLHL